jgi:hypothetical protein
MQPGRERGRWLVVGNPENRRVALFQAALREAGEPAAEVVSYFDLLTGRAAVERLGEAAAAGSMVRLESPGEHAEVERLLIARGAWITGRRDPAAIGPEEFEHGRIIEPGLWYAGFRDLLDEFQRHGKTCRWMNPPRDVAVLFDKPACQRRLHAHGVPVPPVLGTVRGYDELRGLLEATGERQVFVKLPWGSSASGVVAFRMGRGRVQAVTSVEMAATSGDVRLYNSLRVRRYEREDDVRTLFDALGHDGLHVERWMPKAGFDGMSFDLRIVVIAGAPRHIVMRTSRGPLTNLHLGNHRGDVDRLVRSIPPDRWHAVLATCRRAAAVFPACLYLGLDVLLTLGWRTHAILEANAFGDLLPGVLHEGRDTYAAEINHCPGERRA